MPVGIIERYSKSKCHLNTGFYFQTKLTDLEHCLAPGIPAGNLPSKLTYTDEMSLPSNKNALPFYKLYKK